MYLSKVLYPDELFPNKRKDHINEVWYAIMTMDIIEVANVFDDEMTFYDQSKQEFLVMLDDRFKKHKILMDREFYLNIRICYKNHNDDIVHEFVGIQSGINLGLIFDIKNNRIVGVKFCNCLGGIFDLDNYYDW